MENTKKDEVKAEAATVKNETKTEAVDPKKVEKKTKNLPVYEDIVERFDSAKEEEKRLYMELMIRRALDSSKGFKKDLCQTFDNKKNEDGSITHLIGFYGKGTMSEREADDMIVSGETDITKMWVMDKYSDLAKMLK